MPRQVLRGAHRRGIAQVAQALGVAARQTPCTMTLMFAAELLTRRRVFS
jgi:hypothetical protein